MDRSTANILQLILQFFFMYMSRLRTIYIRPGKSESKKIRSQKVLIYMSTIEIILSGLFLDDSYFQYISQFCRPLMIIVTVDVLYD